MGTKAAKQTEVVEDDTLEGFDDKDFEGGTTDFDDEDFEDTPESRGDVVDSAEEEEEEDEPEEEKPAVEEVEEVDDEPEEEPDAPVEETDDDPEEDADSPPDPKANVRVPLARLDAEIARRKAAEERLAKAGQKDKGAEQATDRMGEIAARLEEMDSEMSDASLAGDGDKFAKLRAEERRLNNEILDIRVAETTHAAVSKTRFDTTLTDVEAKYPALNPDSDEYDAAIVEEVQELMEAFEAKGNSPALALRRAVGYVIADVPEEAAPPPPKQGLRDKPAKPARSTETPKKRNQQIKQQQPPSTTGRRSAAEDADPDPMKMSGEEFDRWENSPEGRKARGDYVD